MTEPLTLGIGGRCEQGEIRVGTGRELNGALLIPGIGQRSF